MFETDYDEFAALLDAVYALHGKALPAAAKAIFFRAMSRYPLKVVRAAIDAQVRDAQRGQYPPKPADLIAQIEGAAANDGRPGEDEAWAWALTGMDEAETVMTTPEIMAAFAIARPVLDTGDKIGARMAFKDVYQRLVAEARAAGRPAEWNVSLGWDPEKREGVVTKAVAAGLLPAPEAAAQLPAPARAEPEGLEKLRAAVANLLPASERLRRAQERRNARDRERTEQAKRDADAMVREYEEHQS